MAQIRSITDQAIDRDLPPYGRSDFYIPNILTASGLKEIDIYAALLARVITWEFSFSGSDSVSNSAAGFFSSTTTLSGSFQISVTSTAPATDETRFAFGMEEYAIRTGRSNAVTIGASTGLNITFPPDIFSGTLNFQSAVVSGPQMDTLTTQTESPGVKSASAQFDFEITVSTFVIDGADTYTVFFKLTTNPAGHDNGAGGVTTPVAVGFILIEIPDWRAGTGAVSINIPLYADSIGPDNIIWASSSSFQYAGENLTGTVNLTMRPVFCWRYPNSQMVDTWNNDGTLAISIEQLYNGEP